MAEFVKVIEASGRMNKTESNSIALDPERPSPEKLAPRHAGAVFIGEKIDRLLLLSVPASTPEFLPVSRLSAPLAPRLLPRASH